MHVHFIGIGGTAIGPLAMIAHQFGYEVSGSDKRESQYISYLRKHGINSINIGHSEADISSLHNKSPIDWVVYSSAVSIENTDNPELVFARNNQIKATKRDELLNQIITESGQKLIAVAGTHGKTTTTAMAVWLFNQLNIPVSYSVGAKISFGDMGSFDPSSEFFVYECDEFDRNFLAFSPYQSLIVGVDYDHHEIFPTRSDYQDAFKQFMSQSSSLIVWQQDAQDNNYDIQPNYTVLDDDDQQIKNIDLAGEVNRRNAWQVIQSVHQLTGRGIDELIPVMEKFPGLSRRFEKIAENLYSDYAHTPPKIAGCLQLAHEISSNVVVVYEPLTNRRQHFIKDTYKDLFTGVKKLYWVPSYLAREDPDQPILTPEDLIQHMDNKEIAEAAELNTDLKSKISSHLNQGDTVVCISGGGGESLDEWLRDNFKN